MKKISILLVLMLAITTVQAQDAPMAPPSPDEVTHMKFMGIPMDCNVETFSRRLVKEKGLVRGNFGDTDKPTLKGTFSGYQNCIIVLYGEEGGNIANVGVVLPMQETFSLLKLQYQTMKSRLVTKYGKPDTEVEGFSGYEPSSDYGRMRELREGNAKFECSFMFKEGMIKLIMSSVDYTGGYLQLLYFDFKNAAIANDRALDDL